MSDHEIPAEMVAKKALKDDEVEEFLTWKKKQDETKNKTLDDLRTILYYGEVDSDRSKEVVRKLLEMEAKEPGEPIIMKIASSGGSALDGITVIETMRTITSPVMTFCIGFAFSMALVILASGEKGSRFCTRGSWVMMHQISAGRYQRFDELKTTFGFYERLNDQLSLALAESSGQTYKAIKKDMREDIWMNADETKERGFIDGIL